MTVATLPGPGRADVTLGSASSSAVTLLRATQSPVLWEALGVCLVPLLNHEPQGLDQALGTDAYPDLGDMEGAEVALGQGGPWVSSSWARNPDHLLVLCSPGTCSRPGQHGCEDRRMAKPLSPGTGPKRRQHVVHGLGSGPRVPEAP